MKCIFIDQTHENGQDSRKMVENIDFWVRIREGVFERNNYRVPKIHFIHAEHILQKYSLTYISA